MSDNCPMCGAPADEPFFELASVPVFCNVLWPSVEAAKQAACGDISLSCCPGCGLIFNRRFDPALVHYAPGYENALHFSKTFREFAEEVAEDLVRRYGLQDKVAAEIGCGDGYFLKLLCDRGVKRGLGFDPSIQDHTARQLEDSNITLITELFEAERLPKQVDAVICRHVLEHTAEPVSFLTSVREALGERDAILYFEVPNAQWMLEARSLWDVIYEHCTYWTPLSLAALFSRCGFETLTVRTGFGGQYLMIEARPARTGADGADPTPGELESLADMARGFGKDSAKKLDGWANRLAQLADRGQTVSVWGAGSKGITFVNAVRGATEAVRSAVDVNPRKHGQYVPGCCLPVVAPDAMESLRPDMVLVMNELYEDEIRQELMDRGLSVEIRCL